MRRTTILIAALAVVATASAGDAQSLRGSRASLARQARQARQHDYSYLARPNDVRRFVQLGLLAPVRQMPGLELARVSYPYARPDVEAFLKWLGRRYQAACGEPLVVTSLVRPSTRQPRNASDRSVHPTGMAVDLRRSNDLACRSWLERELLRLEGEGVVEATRERRPPHYHVAVFPRPYREFLATAVPDTDAILYRVRQGDSLWSIARRFNTTVPTLKQENRLRTSRVLAGQTLRIPAGDAT